MPRQAEDLTGQIRGTRYVISRAPDREYYSKDGKRSYRAIYWNTECKECGFKAEVQGTSLKANQQCGACYRNGAKSSSETIEGQGERRIRARKARKETSAGQAVRRIRASRNGNGKAEMSTTTSESELVDATTTQRRAYRKPATKRLSNSQRPLTAAEICKALEITPANSPVYLSLPNSDPHTHAVHGLTLANGCVELSTTIEP